MLQRLSVLKGLTRYSVLSSQDASAAQDASPGFLQVFARIILCAHTCVRDLRSYVTRLKSLTGRAIAAKSTVAHRVHLEGYVALVYIFQSGVQIKLTNSDMILCIR